LYKRKEIIGDATLYLGDCMEVMPILDNVDAVVTDPPYGIGFDYASHDDNEKDWFLLMDKVIPILRAMSNFCVMPCCQIKKLDWWYINHKPDWLIAWYKGNPGHSSHVGFNDWEPHLIWGKPPHQMHDYFQTPLIVKQNGHPCPKPNDWAMWLVSRAALARHTILDPFMGSGTTGVACMNLGRKFIGIEIDEHYFNIACKRISDAQKQGKLFVPEKNKAEQQELF